MATVTRFTTILQRPARDFVYDAIRHLDIRLGADVGAAAGAMTRRIREAGGADTEVVAFEPFPGNHQYFEQGTRDLTNVRLIKKAVSDRIGTAQFLVGSTVQGTEPGWESLRGYSSVGYLTASEAAHGMQPTLRRAARRTLNAVLGRPRPQILTVETTTIDSELKGRTVDFMKIDVQGAESKVLRGATGLLREARIGVLYVEWAGESDVVDFLAACGYRMYDSTYVAAPGRGASKNGTAWLQAAGFDIVGEVPLSTGVAACEMLLSRGDYTPQEAMRQVKSQGAGWWIQTDLIAVSAACHDRFVAAAKACCCA